MRERVFVDARPKFDSTSMREIVVTFQVMDAPVKSETKSTPKRIVERRREPESDLFTVERDPLAQADYALRFAENENFGVLRDLLSVK
ncbi:MAG: hypothetical protein IJM30_10980 [Thermoguttaceae bacterium]|nr:hypothetical protein [Thermoguttaceae bacterium]